MRLEPYTRNKQTSHMRTKSLLLAAAVGLAGALSASAQITNVYSVNAVGYIQLTIPIGFSMIANQLISTNNTIDRMFPAPPDGTQVFAWNGTGFDTYEFLGFLGVWSPNGSLPFNPGGGAFINNKGTTNIIATIVGDVPQGTNSNVIIPSNFSIGSSTVPVAGNLIAAMGFPSNDGDQVFKWNGSSYDTYEYLGFLSAWSPSEPLVKVGESFFIKKTTINTPWNRNFTANN